VNLRPINSKNDIPVYPMIVTYAAVPAEKTQADIFKSNKHWLHALIKCYEVIGCAPDIVFPMNPKDVTFIEQMKVRLPDKDLGDNELFQLIEEEIMTQADYKIIIDNGFAAWQIPFVASIQNPPIKQNKLTALRITLKFIQVGMRVGKNQKYWNKCEIPMKFHT
jgi:hypothetical protein